MKNRVLTIVNVVVLVLLAVIAAMWIRSEFTSDMIVLSDETLERYEIYTTPGHLYITSGSPVAGIVQTRWYSGNIPENAVVLPHVPLSGPWYQLGLATATGRQVMPDGAAVNYHTRSVAFAPVAGLLLLVPLLTLLWSLLSRSRTRRRLERGLCPSCGVNLRGSAYHCPVCGRRVPLLGMMLV